MASADLIMLTAASSPAAEAYRTLRTNLMFSSVEKPITAFVVASAANADDKSATAANLAVAFAQAGHRTVLVDADLRRPQQHMLWDIEGVRGLSTMMTDDAALSSPPLVPTGVDKLHLLPAGAQPGNPADLLSSQRMSDILGLLKARASKRRRCWPSVTRRCWAPRPTACCWWCAPARRAAIRPSRRARHSNGCMYVSSARC
jgi:non-specific protein-tyrosine kinase